MENKNKGESIEKCLSGEENKLENRIDKLGCVKWRSIKSHAFYKIAYGLEKWKSICIDRTLIHAWYKTADWKRKKSLSFQKKFFLILSKSI